MKSLRDHTHKDVERCWSNVQEKTLNEVKSLITSTPMLSYYKPDELLEVQCDSSQAGLGAAFMQGGHPLAYASRALTETDTRYAQIENEALAIVFAMEKFNDYTFGRKTVVLSEHKPLESILKNPLHRAPQAFARHDNLPAEILAGGEISKGRHDVLGRHPLKSVSPSRSARRL
ncbi:uncharacterized protein LOC111329277 [Stylophora pistillata]|nr:uncharacterized protein LOC111329277 [Stylophora pistillata]